MGKKIEMSNKSGIYKITNRINDKVYIGQTSQEGGIEARIKRHIRMLKGKYHKNEHLQSAWNKYGEDNFLFEELEIIEDINLLDEREVFWINYYNSTNHEKGYNKENGGKKNKKFSEESRQKMSLSHIGKQMGESHPSSKITDEQAKEIKILIVKGINLKEISKLTGVNYGIIVDIKYLGSWTHILPELNGELKKKTKSHNFTKEDLFLIRNEYSCGITQKVLAEKWGCDQGTISNIVNFKGSYNK